MGGKVHEPLGGWYHATKFAVEGLSDSLRMELAPFGIQVVVIEPGAIKTEWAGISAEHVRAASADGPYARQASGVAAVLDAGSGPGGAGSSPDVVADAVVKAATARRPRTRYVVGLGARPALFARALLTDRGFDRLLRIGYWYARRR
jgi:NAD(P)-dependent dehydrogenase (short-subunit alcohol dehydrogenase family)